MATEKKFKLIINCETGDELSVEFTPEEYAQAALDAAAFTEAEAARQAAEAEAANKKAAVLEALATAAGLTVEEVTEVLS